MSDYDVLVDTRDPHWGFILQSKSIARAALDTHTRTHAHAHTQPNHAATSLAAIGLAATGLAAGGA